MAKKATATRVIWVLAGIEFKVFISIFFKGFELDAAKCFAHQHDVKVIGGFKPCKGFPSIRRKKPVIRQYFLQIGRKQLSFNGKRRRLIEKFFEVLLRIRGLDGYGARSRPLKTVKMRCP